MTKEILKQMLDDGLNTQQMAEILNCTRRTISNAINRNNLESPRNKSIRLNVKHCAGCKKTLDRSLFYTKSNKNSSLCKSCIVTNNKTSRQTVKQQCIEYLGGCCSKCGYNKCNAALEFHHLDPSQKDKNYTNNRFLNFEKLKPELDKCVLLCANCHREEHHSSTTDI